MINFYCRSILFKLSYLNKSHYLKIQHSFYIVLIDCSLMMFFHSILYFKYCPIFEHPLVVTPNEQKFEANFCPRSRTGCSFKNYRVHLPVFHGRNLSRHAPPRIYQNQKSDAPCVRLCCILTLTARVLRAICTRSSELYRT